MSLISILVWIVGRLNRCSKLLVACTWGGRFARFRSSGIVDHTTPSLRHSRLLHDPQRSIEPQVGALLTKVLE